MTKDHVSQGVWVRVPNCALTPDLGRTRGNKEPSSHGHLSLARIRESTKDYGSLNQRSNRWRETLLVYRDKQGGVMTTIPIRRFWHRLYVSQNGARAAVVQLIERVISNH